MNAVKYPIVASALAAGAAIAAAPGGGQPESQNSMMGMMKHMKAMDSNGDGMVSKDEFMKSHEAMYEMLKKNKEGQVNMTEMPMCSMMDGMHHKGR